MTSEREPTVDWATDFDLGDPRYQHDPYPIWDELRPGCPVARTERRGGAILPLTWDDITAVAYDTDTFSSRDVAVLPPPPETTTLLTAPPITSDPPFHTEARRLLLPRFAPRAVEAVEPKTRSIATALLDRLDGPTADAAGDYAQHIPVRVIAHLLGIPESDCDQFTEWAVDIFQRAIDDPHRGQAATRAVLAYFADHVERRRQEPGDDLISELLEAELEGSPLTPRHIIGSSFLLLLAGIDTTWSSIGASLWHLATHPEDRDRLVAEPELIPTAVEEFLRAYAPVTMARVANTDTELNGCPVHAGDKVLLPFPAGNRDPEMFPDADVVRIDRDRNRHFAFGIGIHRCLGSNLARMELRVAIEEWLTRFPGFTLTPNEEVTWAGTQVRGPRRVPVTLH